LIARPIERSLQRHNSVPTEISDQPKTNRISVNLDCAHIAEIPHVTNHLAVLFPLLALLRNWERFLGLDPPITRDKAIGVSQIGPACPQLRNGLA
jgi:uncharacterized protein YmfQ (DUF2313 family)